MNYTQGGWSKLDMTAAVHLAEVLATFQGEKFEQYARMLLVLYASIGRDGSTTIGRRTLAERADVSEEQARYFVSKLEASGVLVNCGVIKSPGGKYTKRRFYWLIEENEQFGEGGLKKSPTHRGKSPGKFPEGGGKSPENLTHIRYITNISDVGVGALDAAPPHQIADSIYTDASMPWGSAATL